MRLVNSMMDEVKEELKNLKIVIDDGFGSASLLILEAASKGQKKVSDLTTYYSSIFSNDVYVDNKISDESDITAVKYINEIVSFFLEEAGFDVISDKKTNLMFSIENKTDRASEDLLSDCYLIYDEIMELFDDYVYFLERCIRKTISRRRNEVRNLSSGFRNETPNNNHGNLEIELVNEFISSLLQDKGFKVTMENQQIDSISW